MLAAILESDCPLASRVFGSPWGLFMSKVICACVISVYFVEKTGVSSVNTFST